MTNLEQLGAKIKEFGQPEELPGGYTGWYWKPFTAMTLMLCGCGCDGIGATTQGRSVKVREALAGQLLTELSRNGCFEAGYPLERIRDDLKLSGGALVAGNFTIIEEADGTLKLNAGMFQEVLTLERATEILKGFDAFTRQNEIQFANQADTLAQRLAEALTSAGIESVLSDVGDLLQKRPSQDVQGFFNSAAKKAQA